VTPWNGICWVCVPITFSYLLINIAQNNSELLVDVLIALAAVETGLQEIPCFLIQDQFISDKDICLLLILDFTFFEKIVVV
jgi:hypothetical protein